MLTFMIGVFVAKLPKDVEVIALLAADPELENDWEVAVVINCATVMSGWLASITTNVVGVTVVTGGVMSVVTGAAMTVIKLPLFVIPASV